MALPVEALKEVMPCPAQLQKLPEAHPAVLGAAALRQVVVPVLDLRIVLGMKISESPGHVVDSAETVSASTSAMAGSVIVLVHWQDRLIGLLAHEVCGTARLKADALQPLHRFDGARTDSDATRVNVLASATFQHGEEICSLLDPARLAALPGLPWVPDQAHLAGVQVSGLSTSMLLFMCGGMQLGIAAMSVHATVPPTAVRENALKSELCQGVIQHHGQQVPVVDTLALLGLGRLPAREQASVLVLRSDDGGLLALMVDEVRDITRVPSSSVVGMPSLAVLNAELFSGVYRADDGEQYLLLNASGLWTQPLMAGLASMTRKAAVTSSLAEAQTVAVQGPDATNASTPAVRHAAYLCFSAGVENACLLEQVSEIIRYPRQLVSLQGRGELLGLFNHRGQAVPLLCLSRLLGQPAPSDIDRVRVLIVRDGDQALGFAVQELKSIESGCRATPRRAEARPQGQVSDALRSMVELGEGAQRRLLPQLDLSDWMARFSRAGAAHELRQLLASDVPGCAVAAAGKA